MESMCQTQREVANLLLWLHRVSSLPWLHTIFWFLYLVFPNYFSQDNRHYRCFIILNEWVESVIYNESFTMNCLFPDKELLSSKERLELEVTSLRNSLQEQQSKMDILDNALTNAQGNVVRLEEEVRTSNNCCQLFLFRFITWWFF